MTANNNVQRPSDMSLPLINPPSHKILFLLNEAIPHYLLAQGKSDVNFTGTAHLPLKRTSYNLPKMSEPYGGLRMSENPFSLIYSLKADSAPLSFCTVLLDNCSGYAILVITRGGKVGRIEFSGKNSSSVAFGLLFFGNDSHRGRHARPFLCPWPATQREGYRRTL
jgi:hypothetical protein